MENGEIYQRKSIMDHLAKYDYLAKDDDYIEITEWKNGEGYDISIKDKNLFSLTLGEIEAINFLIKKMDYDKKQN